MKNSISEKQLEANRKNSKKGGIKKTCAGKEASKYNAWRHGILSGVITKYDKRNFDELHQRLTEELSPETAVEEILVGRIILYVIRLDRASKTEAEFIKSILDPEEGHYEDTGPLPLQINEKKWITDKKGFSIKIGSEDVEVLGNIYFRYEKSLENRLYRALHELERIQRARRGDKVPPPMSLDIETGPS